MAGRSHPLEEIAFINLQRTADFHQQALAVLFKEHGLTPAQYNVLRILRGARKEGLPCGEVAARMITRDSDITRLLDRMAARDWVSRSREAKDRRVIRAHITEAGLHLVNGLDKPVRDVLRHQFGRFGKQKLEQFIELLEEFRSMDAIDREE